MSVALAGWVAIGMIVTGVDGYAKYRQRRGHPEPTLSDESALTPRLTCLVVGAVGLHLATHQRRTPRS